MTRVRYTKTKLIGNVQFFIYFLNVKQSVNNILHLELYRNKLTLCKQVKDWEMDNCGQVLLKHMSMNVWEPVAQ